MVVRWFESIGSSSSKHTNMISINDFEFYFVGYGHYRVTYTSPKTWKKWSVVTTDMRLIAVTKEEGPFAKKTDLNRLKLTCKTSK